MKLLDITQTYEPGMRHYPSIPDFHLEWVRHYDKGSGMALSRFTTTSHLGTHIDAPYHFLSQGARTIDLPLETLCGPAQVVDARGLPCITRDVLAMGGFAAVEEETHHALTQQYIEEMQGSFVSLPVDRLSVSRFHHFQVPA